MSDGTPSKSNNGSGEILWGFWYPALRSNRVHGRKLERAQLLEVPLVLGRDSAGKAFALRDVCPHRAFPLSFGHRTEQPSSAPTTAGNSTRTRASAAHSVADGGLQTESGTNLCGQFCL